MVQCQKEPVEVVQASSKARPAGRRPRGRPRTRERLHIHAGLGMPRDPPVRASRSVQGKGSLGFSAVKGIRGVFLQDYAVTQITERDRDEDIY